ncbi:hypothetical protein F0562_029723 [Nyssa sinensis]|uniref:Uncharacterized protein n=1 Tax=Nyssa sinensis TaxID=561372 RepID=A0A5J5AUM0_9ASTE|nr:hypothetical protein F0562_029723 [Nyssa sinensis]
MVTLATTSKAGPQSLSRLTSLGTMASPPSRFYWLRRRTRLIRGFQMDCLRICENLYWLKGSGKFTRHGIQPVANNLEHTVIPIPSSRVSAVQDIFSLAALKLGFKFMVMKNDNISEGRKLLRMQFDKIAVYFMWNFLEVQYFHITLRRVKIPQSNLVARF